MGGFMSIFSPPSVPEPAPIVIPTVTTTATTTEDSTAEDERKARLAAVARNKAGLAGTIATTNRGVLTPASGQSLRKSLLGE